MDYGVYSDLYDGEYADYRHDIAFYVKWARRCPPPALELGCGTGRIVVPMGEAGCPITGLDRCPAMLEKARQKLLKASPDVRGRVDLVQADMRDFSLDREFGLIYLPFREFMHLEREEDQLACLDCIHRHLHLDGRLILNLYNMDPIALQQPCGQDVPLYRQKGGDYVDPESGHQVYLSSASTYQSERQMLLEERFYDRVDKTGKVVERRLILLRQRWFFRYEMVHLLHRCQFRVENLFGGYHGQAPGGPGSEMIWIARHARRDELQQELDWLENKLARYSLPSPDPEQVSISRRRRRR